MPASEEHGRKLVADESAPCTRGGRACGFAVLQALHEVHADADEAALAAGARLEQLKVLVDGHRVQDVVHKDACAQRDHPPGVSLSNSQASPA